MGQAEFHIPVGQVTFLAHLQMDRGKACHLWTISWFLKPTSKLSHSIYHSGFPLLGLPLYINYYSTGTFAICFDVAKCNFGGNLIWANAVQQPFRTATLCRVSYSVLQPGLMCFAFQLCKSVQLLLLPFMLVMYFYSLTFPFCWSW